MNLETLIDTPPWEWPRDAAIKILGVLLDLGATAADRALAVSLAGDATVINDDLAAALITIVGDEAADEALRGAAAIALGPVLEQSDSDGFDDPELAAINEDSFLRIQAGLRRVYEDIATPQRVRRSALEAAVRGDEDWHAAAVRRAYDDPDQNWRLTAVFAMRFVAGFEDQILASLNDTNPDIGYEAVCAAGVWQVDGAWPHVVALAESAETEDELRYAAIEAVAGIRPQEAVDVLLPMREAGNDEIAAVIDEALMMAGVYSLADEDDDLDEEDFEEGGTVH